MNTIQSIMDNEYFLWIIMILMAILAIPVGMVKVVLESVMIIWDYSKEMLSKRSKKAKKEVLRIGIAMET